METCCELQKLLTMKVVELLTSRGITKKEVRIQYLLETVIVGRFDDTLIPFLSILGGRILIGGGNLQYCFMYKS